MRYFAFTILFTYAFISTGQLIIKPIAKNQANERGRITETNIVNPATLPFWDDFSVTSDSPDSVRIWGTDTTSQWNRELSKDVFVNATLAVNPPSHKVATFDGLDENGAFHGDGEGLADELVSDTIDLQGRANVILSFYWQAGGRVEIPEAGDSLVLQFHRFEDGQSTWEMAWLQDGGDLDSDQDSVFTQEAIEIDPEFLTQDFLFRFQSYGDLDGPFDAWHVDWIYLNENRQDDSFFYADQGFNEQLSSPFSPFTSLPVNQFRSNVDALSGIVQTGVFNLEDEPDNIGPSAEYILVLRETVSNTIVDSIFYGNQELLGFNPNPLKMTGIRILQLDSIDLEPLPEIDSAILESELYFRSSDDTFLDGTPVNLQINDTVKSRYLLQDYYAFDDGTAEFAAGTNIAEGQVAIKFWLEESDTLTHVDIHFPNIAPSSTDNSLELRVFKNLNDEPIRAQNITVINAEGINAFHRYKLSRSVVLADTFFVGYQQRENEYIGVGFDRSNPEASEYIFENRLGIWEQNTRLSGALMIRPVFAQVEPDTVTAIQNKRPLTVYPNPTKGPLRIDGEYEAISLMNFSGKTLIHETANNDHDFSRLKSGLYLLTIHRKEGDQTLKIIKK
ncbi:T9SS type A sorting domain-containing protein [Ekhidna sp.]